LLVFSDQGLVASSQLGHLLLQRHDLTLQLGYQSSQVFSAQGGDVFGATHSGNVAQNAGGLQDPTAIQLR
jgi:hypothetical protein